MHGACHFIGVRPLVFFTHIFEDNVVGVNVGSVLPWKKVDTSWTTP